MADPTAAAWSGGSPAVRKPGGEPAGEVSLRDGFANPLRTIAGFAVAVAKDEGTMRAAAVLLDADTFELLDRQVAHLPIAMHVGPGLPGFRGLPALCAALAMLKTRPDLAFVDGHGIAHPQRLGDAAHFGVATGVPSIGVATKILVGEARMALHDMRGAFTPLRDQREQIGWLLRSKPGCLPLIVSPGHKVAMASAPELVMRYVTTHRLPEPTRLAQSLVTAR